MLFVVCFQGNKIMGDDTVSIIIIVVCVVMSAYFSATETAFSSLNRIRIKNLADKGDKKAALVASIEEKYDSMLSTILIGNNIVNILSTSLATVLFVKWLGDAGTSASTAVMTIVVLVFGEISPKSIAKESPEKFAMFSAPLLRTLMVVLTPFNWLFGMWKKLLSMIFASDADRGITEEEILTIVEEATNEGGINEQESDLIRNAIEFTELEAGDILTPRIDVEGIEVGISKEEIAQAFTETGYSRLPVYEESLDHIVGIIYHKDFYNYVYNTEQDISSIMRPCRFITKTKKIGDLLKELQQEKLHIAVVVDEFGGTIGIITMEDILEELVGEIWDEHDEIVQAIEKKEDGQYIVLGGANVEKLFEELDIDEAVEVVTVSGWVMNLLGRIPKASDVAVYDKWEITVLEMNGRRIQKVEIKEKKVEEA